MWFYRSDGETAEDVVENFTKIQQLSSEDENSGPKSKEPKAEDNNKPSKKKKYPKLGSYNEFLACRCACIVDRTHHRVRDRRCVRARAVSVATRRAIVD